MVEHRTKRIVLPGDNVVLGDAGIDMPGDGATHHAADNRRMVRVRHVLHDERKAMRHKLRALPGESHPFAKMTWAQVDEMRAMRRQGMKLKQLEPLFGIGKSQISKICRHQSWIRL